MLDVSLLQHRGHSKNLYPRTPADITHSCMDKIKKIKINNLNSCVTSQSQNCGTCESDTLGIVL